MLPVIRRKMCIRDRHYAAALTDPDKLPQLRAYIEQYVRENGYIVEGSTLHELTGHLYREMAEYSILTPYLGAEELGKSISTAGGTWL